MWRVLIVEDDPGMREFFAASVAACPELRVAASLGTLGQALAWLDEPTHAVDVLLTDLGLPDGSGLSLIHRALALNPACEPLVISMFGDDDNVLAAVEAGALGYIHKDSAPDDIAQTILEMKAGASPISPMIARRVLAKYRFERAAQATGGGAALTAPEPTATPAPAGGDGAARARQESEARPLLSPREHEVLGLIARGFSYAEIARLQAVSVHTVQTHIKNLYRKLAVRSRGEAVFEATQLGLLGGEPPR